MNIQSYLRPVIAAGCLTALLLTGCGKNETTVTEPETTEPAIPETIATEPAPTDPVYKTKDIGGTECYSIGNMVYSVDLGAPILGKEAAVTLYNAGDSEAAAEQITNLGDAYFYCSKAPKFHNPKDACLAYANLLVDDYDSIGFIELNYNNNYYCILYIEQDGMYYAVDAFTSVDRWVVNPENDCLCNPDLDILAEKLEAALPYKGTQLLSIKTSPYDDKSHGSKTFSYVGTSIPVGLGKPLLSDEEIDALIAEQDFEKTAATISTLADAVNYYKRAGITFYDKRNNNGKGVFVYVQSAWQVLKSNEGQCVSMSNLNHYLLKDDYDEVGYVSVRSPGDGHVMTYILEDGVYYLINSVDYTKHPYYGWLDSYPEVLGCAEDFQAIADSLVENMRLGDRKPVTQVHLVKSPGDYVNGEGGKIYPIGCEVIPYYGVKYITYQEAGYEWDTQIRIDY